MLETLLSELIAELKNNTAALREVIDAGAVPSNVVAITETPKPVAKKQAKVKTPEPVTEPEPEPVTEPEPTPVTETPTKVPATGPAPTEFSDPLDKSTVVVVQGDPEVDVSALITQITETFSAALKTDRRQAAKDAFPILRAKWGMQPDDKLIALASTPEKLIGLLEDIKAL